MSDDIQEGILNELRVIKKLLAQNLLAGQSQTKQITKLDSLGFQPKEIAEILGTTSNTVRVTLSKTRSEKKRRKQEPNIKSSDD